MRHFRARAALFAGALTIPLCAAFAQTPTPLTPVTPPPTSTTPVPPPEPAIETSTLGAVDPSSIGLLDANSGGLSAELWTGSNKAAIQTLLPKLPVATGSAASDDLARRLLLTAAPAAEGAPAEGDSLLSLKLERLMAQGDTEEITRLQPSLGNLASDPKAARVVAQADLLLDRMKVVTDLCDLMLKSSSDPFWLKLGAFLQFEAGNSTRADLSLQMAHDQDAADSGFFDLMDALAAPDKAKITAPKNPSILHLAMMRVLKLNPPREALATHEPALLRYYSTLATLDPSQRLAAAEKLAGLGLGDPKLLSELYGSVTLNDPDRVNPIEMARKSPGPHGRAILFQAARNTPTPQDQAAALVAGLTPLSDLGLGESLAAADRVVVQSLPPTPNMLPYAAGLGRILVLGVDIPGAIKWDEGFRPLANPGSREASDLALLDLLVTLADPAAARPLDPAALDIVLKDAQTWPADQRAQRLGILLAALDAVGAKPPPSAWRFAVGAPGQQGVDMAALRATRDASEAGLLGETIILALTLIGPGGPAKCDSLALSEALLALMRVHLNAEARRIAVEAVLGHGL